MPDFVTVAKVGAIPEGQGGTFAISGQLVAVFNVAGEYYAIDDLCPHMGASLGAGRLDEQCAVVCPWHAWRFNVRDGTWCDNPRLKIASYPTRVHGEEIQVLLVDRNKQPADGDH